MSVILIILVFSIGILLQLSVVPFFGIKEITPDLLLIIIIGFSVQYGRIWGITAGFFSGLLFDFLSTGLIGVSSMAGSVAAFMAGGINIQEMDRRFVVFSGLIFITIFTHDLIYFVILLLGTGMSFWNILFTRVIPHSLYSLLFILIFHLVIPNIFWGRRKVLNY
jgi:rod shape-determining protein MreD